LNPGGHMLICDVFQTEAEGKSALSGGHRLKSFNEVMDAEDSLELVTDIDITENTAPLIIWRKEYRPDSGGKGEFRGGVGGLRASLDDADSWRAQTSALLRVPRLVRTEALRSEDAEDVQQDVSSPTARQAGKGSSQEGIG